MKYKVSHYILISSFLVLTNFHFLPLLHAELKLIRNIVLTGNRFISDQQIRDLMVTNVNQTYNPDLLEKDFQRIITFYQDNGYRFARIDRNTLFTKQFSEGVYLRIHIDEGKIGGIIVTGNRRTQKNVIVRELLFQVGSIYKTEDEFESERILRRKPYLGSAEIFATRDSQSKLVRIEVAVTDVWTIMPTLDLPTPITGDRFDLLITLSDSNLLGLGNSAGFRFHQIHESEERTRNLWSFSHGVPRIFDSHWGIYGIYTQTRVGDSWQARLYRPLYSLQTKWSGESSFSESIDPIHWYDKNGKKTDTFERHLDIRSGQIIRVFGNRYRRTLVGLWTKSSRSIYFKTKEGISLSKANLTNRITNRIGISIEKVQRTYIRTRFLNQMGRVEDVGLGHYYGASIGQASRWYGSDQTDSELTLSFASMQTHRKQIFLNTLMGLVTNFDKKQIYSSILTALIKVTAKDLYYQTLVLQLKTAMGFNLDGKGQILLGNLHGLRGYRQIHFSGEKKIVINAESRTVFWENTYIILGSAAFIDIGYIWKDIDIDIWNPKRSIGFGLRFSSPKLSGFQVYRLDLAFPLDRENRSKPVISYAVGQAF
ncbi:MAG: POTRA domain-containing protein [Candidatus Poribacteria bacterium]|nr:POTRA domain-containing protein [Candidatus Poribacteria bacterium]